MFENLAGFERGRNELANTERAETIEVGYVSPTFFPLFRVRPEMGRTFVAEEKTPGRAVVAVISHEFWRSHCSDPDVIGKDVELSNNLRMRVVGVLPAEVRVPDDAIPIWTPLPIYTGAGSGREPSLEVYARLRPDTTIEAASIEFETIAARLEQVYPETNSGVGVTLVSLLEQRVGRARATLVVFLGAIVSVLLIGVLNLVHLQMACGARREREMSIRVALGAKRGRLLGQLLTEAMLLALAGGTAGFLLSVWSMDALLAHLPYSIPRQADTRIDRTVSFRGVSPSYFETMRIDLVSGQTLGEGPEGGVLVGELLASRLWPGESPIGKRIKRGGLRRLRALAHCNRCRERRPTTGPSVRTAVRLVLASGTGRRQEHGSRGSYKSQHRSRRHGHGKRH